MEYGLYFGYKMVYNVAGWVGPSGANGEADSVFSDMPNTSWG